jgi:hypothetical protein
MAIDMYIKRTIIIACYYIACFLISCYVNLQKGGVMSKDEEILPGRECGVEK